MVSFQFLLHAHSLLGRLGGVSTPTVMSPTAIATFDRPTEIIHAGIGYQASFLFGGLKAWYQPGRVDWHAVDDRVRGGTSHSYFEELARPGQLWHPARFSGNLDTKTLGGAGFASVATDLTESDGSKTTYNLTAYDGLLVQVVEGDDKKYTLTVKDDDAGERDDRRVKSRINWEFDFDITQLVESEVLIPWSGFRATYRGRDIDPPRPLDPSHIKQFSILIRRSVDYECTLWMFEYADRSA